MNNVINKIKTCDLPNLPLNWLALQEGYIKGRTRITVWKCGKKRVLIVYAEGEATTRSLVNLIEEAEPASDSVKSFVRREVRRALKREMHSTSQATNPPKPHAHA